MNNFSLSRRRMIASIGILTVAPEIILGQERRNSTTIFVEESGILATEKPFVVGALLMTDPQRHLKHLAAIRDEQGYYLTLRYGSNDEHKLPYARRVLEYFLADNDLAFSAVECSAQTNGSVKSDSDIKRNFYQHLYQRLLDRCSSKNRNLSLGLRQRTKNGSDRFLHAFLKERFATIDDIRTVRAHLNDLMQVADLLVGCVWGEKNKHCEVKEYVIEILRHALSVENVWSELGMNHPKFKVMVM